MAKRDGARPVLCKRNTEGLPGQHYGEPRSKIGRSKEILDGQAGSDTLTPVFSRVAWSPGRFGQRGKTPTTATTRPPTTAHVELLVIQGRNAPTATTSCVLGLPAGVDGLEGQKRTKEAPAGSRAGQVGDQPRDPHRPGANQKPRRGEQHNTQAGPMACRRWSWTPARRLQNLTVRPT